MATAIQTTLDEASDVGLSFTLADANGTDVNAGGITSIHYTWSNADGEAINSRDNVSVTAANPVIIKLDDTDTAITETSNTVTRRLTIKWVYDDEVLGSNSVKTKEFAVQIENYVNA